MFRTKKIEQQKQLNKSNKKMTVINTYNENSLHRTLKNIYALEFSGKTEQKSGRFICDIITQNDEIIEIQTSNISALKRKIEYFLNKNKKIKIVHPLIEEKIIKTFSPDATLLSKRKSPAKQTVYTALRSLTGIYTFLGNKNLSIEFLNVKITEIRRQTEQNVQNKTKSRRHLKNYLVTDKILETINSKQIFHTKEDWKSLLPQSLPDFFTPPELQQALLKKNWPQNFSKTNIKSCVKCYTLLIWLLEKMHLIKKTDKKKGKSWIYKIN